MFFSEGLLPQTPKKQKKPGGKKNDSHGGWGKNKTTEENIYPCNINIYIPALGSLELAKVGLLRHAVVEEGQVGRLVALVISAFKTREKNKKSVKCKHNSSITLLA